MEEHVHRQYGLQNFDAHFSFSQAIIAHTAYIRRKQ